MTNKGLISEVIGFQLYQLTSDMEHILSTAKSNEEKVERLCKIILNHDKTLRKYLKNPKYDVI